MAIRFEDRADAGRRLAAALPQLNERPDTVLLGLARGGIPVAAAAAKALNLPFGAVLVRKLGIPGHDETAFGALAWFGGRIVRLVNRPLVETVIERHGIRQEWLDDVETRERHELIRRVASYPGIERDVRGKTVVLVDDGLATGATMRAAVEAVRSQEPAAVVAAAPVSSIEAHATLQRVCDAVVVLYTPGKFRAVGGFYTRFQQLEDAEVVSLLETQDA
jgi:predicted phosphoribosyltransferase